MCQGTTLPHSVNTSKPTKRCPRCRQELAAACFYSNKSQKHRDGLSTYCRPCSLDINRTTWKKNYKRNKPTFYQRKKRWAQTPHGKRCIRGQVLKSKYGITLDDYELLLKRQSGVCAICKAKPRPGRWGVLAVDHCHKTGRVRGLLCCRCNNLLRDLGDDLESVLRFVNYLSQPAHNA